MQPFYSTTKRIFGLLCVFGILIFSTPYSVRAQQVVTDPGNTVQGVLQVIEGTTQTVLQNSTNYKEFVLDLLVNVMAKQLINQMTQSIVNWINSGFEGNPSFVTNPESFFLDAADQITGSFLSQNGNLSALCSPFNFDIRISLALQLSGRYHQRYTCTLGTIIQNTRDAAERGVTINGFMAGDFSQGGWPAFIALSTEPQNNFSGAYLYAQSDLMSRISQREASINIDLNRGRGFMSWQNCEDIPFSAEALSSEDPTDPRLSNYYETGEQTYEHCTTETPGSVIETTLTNQLGSGVRQLELADEINEIVGALVNQLVVQILNTGLNSASKGSGGRPSTVSRILGENEKTVAQVQKLGKTLAGKLTPYLDRDEKVISTYQQAVNVIEGTQTKFLEVRSCWIGKGVSGKVSQTENTINAKVIPLVNEARSNLNEASTTMEKLLEIKRVALTATTTAQIQPASDLFSDMLQEGSLRTSSDLQNAKDELKDIRGKASDLNAEAALALTECQNYLSSSLNQ